eukprot:TRINITY_DN5685_c0_g1_i1.p1 TRINITY_DN5685_c0_g1~~TRINITY_DN5685_c0_g1_i1.p1  ORF type:complete len:146 (+),score=39.12 TRINITY_DN5685_c0_g1_i1:63-440(+)
MALYEVATRNIPWSTFKSPQEQYQLRQMIGQGIRPELSDDIPGEFSNLVKGCWNQDSKTRPKIKHVLKVLHKLGLMNQTNPVEELIDNYVTTITRLEEEMEILRKLREAAERRAEEAQASAGITY